MSGDRSLTSGDTSKPSLVRRAVAIGAACVLLSSMTASILVGSPAVAEPEAAKGSPVLPGPSARLISQSQYFNSIAQVFGSDIVPDVRFASVNRVDGLVASGAGTAQVTSGVLAPFERAARAVAGTVVDRRHRAALIPCTPARTDKRDDACASEFLGRVGRLLYRRKLEPAELEALVELAGSNVGPAGDFYDSLSFALAGMLVSPDFLFITETPRKAPERTGSWELDGYSKASRLSFLLWDSAPDDALLTAAESGKLDTPAGLRREVDRMLASSLYEKGVRAFIGDFLVTENFLSASKDSTIYPDFSLTANTSAREQVLRMAIDHLVTRRGDYRDLFTTRRIFLNPDLAVLYRLPVDVGRDGWAPYDLPAGDTRAGILTQIGFLATYAHAGRSSPTRRGRAVRETLLCQHVPDPPPNVDFSNFENPSTPLPTARERLIRHNENPVCAGCHMLTDPIGLTLENFDGAGQFRETEQGAPIDVTGDLDGVPFKDAVGLGQALRDSPSLKSCIVNRLYAYSTGRKAMPDDRQRLGGYESLLDRRGYRFDDMFRLFILDPDFFSVRAPQPHNLALSTPRERRHAH